MDNPYKALVERNPYTSLVENPNGATSPSYDPTEGMSNSEKFFADIGRRVTNAGRSLGQFAGLISQQDIDEARRLDAPLRKAVGEADLPVEFPYDPATGMSVSEKRIAGAQASVYDIGRSLGEFTGLISPQDVAEARRLDAPLLNTEEGKQGHIGGDIALTMIPGVKGQQLLTSAAKAVLPRLIAKTVAPTAAAVGTGAGISLLTQPVTDQESRLENAEHGAIGGVVGDAAARVVSRVAQPVIQSGPVQALLKRGIVPTIGQASGPGSIVNRFEQKMSSVLGIGDIIKNARFRPVEEVNRAAIQSVAPEINEIGHAGIAAAESSVGQRFRNALNKFDQGVSPFDESFLTSTKTIPQDAGLLISREQKNQFGNFVRTKILDPARNDQGSMTGEIAKKIDSEIGAKIRDLRGSSSASERDLGKAFRNLQTEFRGLMERSAPNPEVSAELADANRRYANFVRIQEAAGSAGARDGVFSLSQLQAAVRKNDHSLRKGAFAKGDALMQDLSAPAKSVLGDTVPNSGSIDRAMVAAALGLGGAGVNEYFGGPAYLSALAAAPFIYSRAGSRYALGDLIPRVQQPVANLARLSAPYAAQIGREINTNISDLQKRPK